MPFGVAKLHCVRHYNYNVRIPTIAMTITPTQLRANLYKLLDQVLETKSSIQILRNGQILEISVKNKKKKTGSLASLKPHPNTINGNPEGLVHVDWSSNWQGDKEL